MSPQIKLTSKVIRIPKKLAFQSDDCVKSSCIALGILGLFMYLFSLSHSTTRLNCQTIKMSPLHYKPTTLISPTNVSHIVFGLCGSSNAWKNRRSYIESWWLPNTTRGYIFLDGPPDRKLLPWPTTSPPFRVSDNTSHFKVYTTHISPLTIRIARVILETFRETNGSDVRWYVLGDDDTVLFLDNLVQVLSEYDHNKLYYIGGTSECTKSNFDFSFDMAYGGGGIALSYPLAALLVNKLDQCIERYPYLFTSDLILQACLSDLGVSFTPNKGFHQLDLVGDISGLLSSHPPSPLISFHHFDIVEPIFPNKTRHNSLDHLMKAAKVDQSRLMQQTICYHKPMNWSFTVSWGYSAHVYERFHPASFLKRPLQTFLPWKADAKEPLYMFNTRPLSTNPCEAPHVFFFDAIEKTENETVTSYVRAAPRGMPACLYGGNHSADEISKILVFTSPVSLYQVEDRRECCDVTHASGMGTTEVRFRACAKDEMTVMV